MLFLSTEFMVEIVDLILVADWKTNPNKIESSVFSLHVCLGLDNSPTINIFAYVIPFVCVTWLLSTGRLSRAVTRPSSWRSPSHEAEQERLFNNMHTTAWWMPRYRIGCRLSYMCSPATHQTKQSPGPLRLSCRLTATIYHMSLTFTGSGTCHYHDSYCCVRPTKQCYRSVKLS